MLILKKYVHKDSLSFQKTEFRETNIFATNFLKIGQVILLIWPSVHITMSVYGGDHFVNLVT